MGTVAKVMPVTDDVDSAGFFDGAREGRLMIRACQDCASGIHPPMAHCPYCGSWNTHWRVANGRGTLHTWTVVERQVHAAYPTPYTLVSVELDDVTRVRLVGRIPGAPELTVGLPMEVFFDPHEDDVVLPNWRPAV
ncbi:OB-fold domain-containing protein [Comamonadaceae bacterium G21597-S1]|nr:OB-fold domain-containing protein [Comamonadaceae bacterium G21597-S1]